MKHSDIFILFFVISVGVFAALCAWSLLVKQQLASSTQASPVLSALTNL